MSESRPARGPLNLVHLDFSPQHRQPAAVRVAIATIVAVAASLVADAVIVVIAERLFPSTKGYVHFQFGDYAKLTIIGVLIACLGWPVITRVSSVPRWIYSRLAVIVTLVLLLPDVWLLHQGQPIKAVLALMVMHLAIAVVTYVSVVRVAPVRSMT
ncbi:MAG: hypothetical protein J0H43_13655 [Actinobacteria bacterium]|nr:hypothetical protein [Actinomycetota bacterium]